MAQSPLDTPADHDREKPNHMIFWLDASIGNPKEYTHLKKAFGSNTDPRCETWTMLNDEDYHNILVEDDAVTVSFEGVQFLLQAFDNEKDCLKAFEANQDKHIFFITSGKLGEHTVPKVIEQYRNIFTDLINNKPYSSIYVYCHNIEFQLEWTMDYLDYIQVFNFDADLLQRMTRDIAEYFIERCKRLRQANDIEGALQRLYWAKRLWRQYDKMDQNISTDEPRPVKESQKMKEINKLIEEIESELPKSGSDEDAANSDDDCVQSSEPTG